MPLTVPPGSSRRSWLAGAFALWLADAAAQGRHPDEVSIGGTGVGLGVLQAALAGRSGVHFVSNLGTGGGLKAVAAGAIDIALSARRLGNAERAAGLVERELLRTPMVWAVHAAVPLERASSADLAALYSARTPGWSDGTPVRLVLRPESDSDTHYMKALSAAMAEALAAAHARPGVHVAVTDMDAVESIERIPGSLGITTLGLLRAQARRVKVLELDGVRPSLDNLLSGRWPHAKRVVLVHKASAPRVVTDFVTSIWAGPTVRALGDLACQIGAPA